MSPLTISILVKATLTLVLALVGARLARNRRAATRHVVLVAAFAILLVLPIASIVMPSIQIAVPVTARENSAPPFFGPLTHVVSSVAVTAAPAGVTEAMPLAFRISVLDVFLAGWFAGIAVFFAPIVLGLRQTYWLCRTDRSWREGQSRIDRLASEAGIRRRVRVLLHESVRCPMTCGIVNTAVILPMESQSWTEGEVTRAIVHELEHVRRGDWLNGCLSRAVCASYWFHPLVWVAWRQLRLEAERACDDAVLRHADPTAYADQLVVLAQHLSTQANLVSPAMAGTGDLTTRVRAILDTRQQRGRAGSLCAVLACVVSMLFVGSISPLRLVTVASQAANGPSFEVASVRPAPEGVPRAMLGGAGGFSMPLSFPACRGTNSPSDVDAPMNRCVSKGHTLKWLIALAYEVPWAQINTLITGGPEWVDTDGFVVEAKAESPSTESQLQVMLQRLLATEFNLKFHREKKEMRVLALVVAKGGPKFSEASKERDCSGDGERACSMAAGSGSVKGRAQSMNALASTLSMWTRQTIVDKTGLTGLYDFEAGPYRVDNTKPVGPHDEPILDPDTLPTIFTALQEQLGLRLEPQRAEIDVLVIDSAVRP